MTSATIKLFLPFGDPKRLRTAEISNWNGKAVACPRTELEILFERAELDQSGVYLLTGTDPDSGNPMCYIGEAEIIKERLKQHRGKDFWVQVIVFVSKDENLTKAHIRYLEGRLIEDAAKAGRVTVSNSQASGARLPESDREDMEVFLNKVRQLLPVLGSDLLTPIIRQADKPTHKDDDLVCLIKGLTARGRLTPNGFVVFQKSQAVLENRPSAVKQHPYVVSLRERLVSDGTMQRQNDHYVFTKDVEFSSPSAAASVVRGGGSNGLIEWKNKNGKSLKEIEDQ
jgi:Domain of unknown function (DUF4357)